MSTGPVRRWRRVAAVTAAVLSLGGVGVAVAGATGALSNGSRGVNEFGKTDGAFKGLVTSFTYTKGFYCDTSVKAASATKCEVGANFIKPPAKQYDPLYITVPLGFTEPMSKLECPDGLVCVDHPMTLDLSRLEPALKPLYPTLTAAQLTAALKNAPTPGHDHFVTDLNNRKPEWWDVKVVGVTNKAVFDRIERNGSFGYIQSLLKAKNPNVVGPIDSNLFLYFGVGANGS